MARTVSECNRPHGNRGTFSADGRLVAIGAKAATERRGKVRLIAIEPSAWPVVVWPVGRRFAVSPKGDSVFVANHTDGSLAAYDLIGKQALAN